MTITFEQFDTTVANLRTDLVSHIVAHADWDDITPGSLPATTLATNATNSTTTYTLTSAAGFSEGMLVKFTNAGTDYYRYITNVAGNVITVDSTVGVALTAVNGIPVVGEVNLVKSTTTRGAEIVLDLAGTNRATNYLEYHMYVTHTGSTYTSGTGMSTKRRVTYSTGGQAAGNTLHVILSISKEHIFFSIEGPRPGETGATNATYGSVRNYMFACDVVPYHDSDDEPCIATWSLSAHDTSPDVGEGIHRGAVSVNSTDTSAWIPCRFPTVTLPHFASGAASNVQNLSTIDGNMYMWPYLVVQDDEGLRGRLASFFFVGINRVTVVFDFPSNTGEFFEQDGIVFKTLEVHKGDSTQPAGGGFGIFSAASGAGAYYSPVVAVPYDDAV